MMFPLYTLAYGAAGLALAPFYLVRGLTSGKYLWSLKPRLGLGLTPLTGPGPRIWVHALSLGETVAAGPLADRLTAEGRRVAFSSTTRSGFEQARASLPGLYRFAAPLDWPAAVRRTLDAVRPDLFVLVETDIWPNLLAGLTQARIPAVLVNARVSPRSLAGYRLVSGWWSRVLNLFESIGCQTDLDRERFLALGAHPDRLTVTGNLKFDRPTPETGPQAREALLSETGLADGLWLAAGSTHPGEDEAIIDIFGRLSARFPDLKLLLAPRNRNRFEPVWRLAFRTGLPAARRSAGRAEASTRIFLLDTLGELDRFYQLADLVFVGKSLPVGGEGGGHNVLEPAARSKPVVFGPRMHNFPEAARLLAQGKGGLRVEDAAGLEKALGDLLADPELRVATGRRARELVEAHRGALDRTMNLLDRALSRKRSSA